MKCMATALSGVVLIEPQVFGDARGWFMESFNERRFHEGLHRLGLPRPRPFVQDNHSLSHQGVLRGLHYQLPPQAQGKLVRVLRGAVMDVAVDIRRGSPTFGQSVTVELSARNHRMLWIPEGFAHGFLALEDNTEFFYKTTAYYAPECERCLAWNDPALAIDWPAVPALQVSEKDARGVPLAGAEVFERMNAE